MHGVVVAVSRSTSHTFTKRTQASIQLLTGLGVEGDAHMGATVKHRSRVAVDPTQPNLRQGLRNPCAQLDRFQEGLMSALLDRDEQGKLIRKAGVMAIAITSGEVRAGDSIRVRLPPAPHLPLDRV